MNIYVSHSRNYDFKNELYQPIKDSELSSQHQFIFPHETSDQPFNSKDLLQNKKCDLMIAEVSLPATGQGIELGWANAYDIPVICIYKKDANISGSLKVITEKFIEYKDLKDLIKQLETFLNSHPELVSGSHNE